MSLEKFILELEKANPKLFIAKKIEISTIELKNHLARAYNKGFDEGEKVGKNSQSYFEKIFGK